MSDLISTDKRTFVWSIRPFVLELTGEGDRGDYRLASQNQSSRFPHPSRVSKPLDVVQRRLGLFSAATITIEINRNSLSEATAIVEIHSRRLRSHILGSNNPRVRDGFAFPFGFSDLGRER